VFVTTPFRLIVCGPALLIGLYTLTAAAAAPVLPKDTYKKAAEADIAQLQKHIETSANDMTETKTEAKRFDPTAKSMAMMLALYGEATGDAALKEAALKVADEIGKKNYKAAGDLAKKLVAAPGAAPLKPADIHKLHKYDLAEVMSPFRGAKNGGLNIDRDIKDLLKKEMATKADPVAIEILAGRTAILGEYMAYFPNEKAAINPANKAKWEKWSKQTVELSKQLAEEATKGKGANERDMLGMLLKLNARCSDCHNAFRDD